MTIIGQSVWCAHLLGIMIIAIICVYNICVRCEQASDNLPQEKQPVSALTIVDNPVGDEDGVVTVVENEEVAEEDTVEVEDFQPTDEWKDVKKGQKIPPGLHVRMDFQTGQNQAKLLDDGKMEKTQKWDGGDKIGVINTQQRTRFTRDELKKALKDFKYKDVEPETNKETVRNKFRSYSELKKTMQEMRMTAKTEGEIMMELLNRLKEKNSPQEETVTVLTDLEYYLHQIDTAQTFSDAGGLLVLMSLMNHTDHEIRATAAYAVGAALQSNVRVQVTALESGLMQQLLKMLSVDSSFAVRKKSMFALSTLIRQFPYAQTKFMALGGLSALADLFKSSQDEVLQIKIITLLTDLLQEYDYNTGHAIAEDSIQSQRALQYKEVELRQSMSSAGWCSLVTSLLLSSSDHDSVEKVITAMSALASTCNKDFSPARTHLQGMLSSYQELARDENEEGQDDFFRSIHSSLRVLIGKLYKDEL